MPLSAAANGGIAAAAPSVASPLPLVVPKQWAVSTSLLSVLALVANGAQDRAAPKGDQEVEEVRRKHVERVPAPGSRSDVRPVARGGGQLQCLVDAAAVLGPVGVLGVPDAEEVRRGERGLGAADAEDASKAAGGAGSVGPRARPGSSAPAWNTVSSAVMSRIAQRVSVGVRPRYPAVHPSFTPSRSSALAVLPLARATGQASGGEVGKVITGGRRWMSSVAVAVGADGACSYVTVTLVSSAPDIDLLFPLVSRAVTVVCIRLPADQLGDGSCRCSAASAAAAGAPRGHLRLPFCSRQGLSARILIGAAIGVPHNLVGSVRHA